MAKDWLAIFKALVVCGSLLGLAIGIRHLGFQDPSIGVLTIIAAAFVLIFTITSGRLASVGSPGGLNATFRDFFAESAEEISNDVVSEQIEPGEAQMVTKGGSRSLDRAISRAQTDRHSMVQLKMGNLYDPDLLRQYESGLARVAKSVTFVIVDNAGRFVGNLRPNTSPSRSRHFFISEQRDNDRPGYGHQYRRLLDAIARDYGELSMAEMPILNGASLENSASRSDALKYFASHRDELVVIVDARSRPTGLLSRSDLLLEVAKFAKSQ